MLKHLLLLIPIGVGLLSCKTESVPLAVHYFSTEVPEGIEYPSDLDEMPLKGIELGKRLFLDKNISSSKTISCGSCHLKELAFADGIALSNKGVSGEVLPRHSPVLFNLAWHQDFFWDGGAPDLESQALGPLFSEHEMNANFDSILSYLKSSPSYRSDFNYVFPEEEITSKQVLLSLAWFQKSLLSFDSKYDAFLTSKDSSSFSDSELKGLKIFDAQCQSCHTLPLGSSYDYANNELDSSFDYEIEDERLGRYRVTDVLSDLGKHKIPSVRNLSFSAPYMHDGRFESLDRVLQHYIELEDTENIHVELKNENLTDLKAFLYTLNDSSFVKN